MTEEKKQLWPGWETIREIGAGSFGKVYEIQRDTFGERERAALKVISVPRSMQEVEDLRSSRYSDAEITEHFRDCLESIVREYTLMSKMKGHGNIVYCEDLEYIQQPDGYGWDIYIKMELLSPMLKAFSEHYDEELVIRLGRDICSALSFCQKKNVLHRDIKPQNIFVSEDGSFKLGDFGVAKVTEATATGTTAGTYKYMAPEIYCNEAYGFSADVYSLGIVLYEQMNRGRSPFYPMPPDRVRLSDAEEAKRRRMSGEAVPEPVDGSAALKRIVLKACAPNREDRYRTAEEMLRDLEHMAQPEDPAGEIPDEDATILSKKPEAKKKPVPEKQSVPIPDESSVKPPKPVPAGKKASKKKWVALLLAAVAALAVFLGGTTAPRDRDKDKENLMGTWKTDTAGYFWGQSQYKRTAVRSVLFRSNVKDIPENAWDVSANGDGSVLAWLKDGKLIVAANGKVTLNPDASSLFSGFECVKSINFNNAVDSSRVTDMSYLFSNCVKLTSLDLEQLDTSNVTDMFAMFYGCESLPSINVTGFDTSRVENMGYMFSGCKGISTLNVREIDTSHVLNMKCMFSGCKGITSLNLNSFDTSAIAQEMDMEDMFAGCDNLTVLSTNDEKIRKVFEER